MKKITPLLFAGLASGLTLLALSSAPAYAQSKAAPAENPDYDPTKTSSPAAAPAGAPAVAPVISIPTAAAPTAAPNAAPAATPPPTDKKSFMWEVKSATTTVYLFGTMHVGEKSFYPLPEAVESALKRATKVVVEADISKTPDKAQVSAMTEYKAPDSLDRKIPAELFDRLKAVLAKYKIPVTAVRTMKPVMVGGLLSLVEYDRLGYDMRYGVDAYVLDTAKLDKKPVLELETQLAQMKMLDSMPAPLQLAFLENAVTGIENGNASIEVADMVRAWQKGDEAMLVNAMTEADKSKVHAGELEDIILYKRHPEMANKIAGYLATHDVYFVAVGSLHLVGNRGLLAILKSRGYQVTQK